MNQNDDPRPMITHNHMRITERRSSPVLSALKHNLLGKFLKRYSYLNGLNKGTSSGLKIELNFPYRCAMRSLKGIYRNGD